MHSAKLILIDEMCLKHCLQNEWCLHANRVINEQKKKNGEDFKNESSENKCQIKKQFTVCVLKAKKNSSAKNLTYRLSEQLKYLNICLILFTHNGRKTAEI